MIINKTIVYAISCLYYLNDHCKDGWCDVKDISKDRVIPYAYCNKILQKLVAKNIVESKKGYGFRLKKDINEISLNEFFDVFNGKSVDLDDINLKIYNVVKGFFDKSSEKIKLKTIFREIKKRDRK